MNDTIVTVVGNVVADPVHTVTASGTHVASLRIASTSRRFDRGLGEWRDAATLFITVSCWRALAENVAASISKGDPVIVSGRLRMRTYTGKDDQRRLSVEIEATAVGHDLSRGVARFQRAQRIAVAERQATEELAEAWTASGGGEEGAREPTEGGDDDAGGVTAADAVAASAAA